MTVNMGTLLEHQSGAKHPKLIARKNNAFAVVLPTKPYMSMSSLAIHLRSFWFYGSVVRFSSIEMSLKTDRIVLAFSQACVLAHLSTDQRCTLLRRGSENTSEFFGKFLWIPLVSVAFCEESPREAPLPKNGRNNGSITCMHVWMYPHGLAQNIHRRYMTSQSLTYEIF